MVGRPVTWQAVRHWRKEKRRLPVDVAEAFLAAIEAKVEAGQTLASELRNHIASERKIERRRQGICSVRFDASGNAVTGQGRGGRAY